jgi:FAD/FMN-containing dehydrogenase
MAKAKALESSTEDYLKSNNIEHWTPGSDTYESFRSWVSTPSCPCVITVPKSVSEVQAIVRHSIEQSIPFTVQGGGHDLYGRSTLQDGLTISMRRLNGVSIAENRKTATIGGGVLFTKLIDDLAAQGLLAATGTVGSIGYVGWATHGGYGWSTNWAGLGVDQIVGAKLVNAQGEVVEADAEMLRGIRGGGGGNFGVIVELTIKLYPDEEVGFLCLLSAHRPRD